MQQKFSIIIFAQNIGLLYYSMGRNKRLNDMVKTNRTGQNFTTSFNYFINTPLFTLVYVRFCRKQNLE